MPVHELAPKTGAAAGSNEQLDQQLRTILENLQQVMKEAEPVEKDDLSPGIAPHLDHEVLERDVAIENRMKRRSSRRFARYLIAICFGVVGTLAWQSYGDAAKHVIATKAPELGWSPEAKRMIASWCWLDETTGQSRKNCSRAWRVVESAPGPIRRPGAGAADSSEPRSAA
jgi:hypothetical protein